MAKPNRRQFLDESLGAGLALVPGGAAWTGGAGRGGARLPSGQPRA